LVGWFRGVEGISLVGGEVGRYLGTSSFDWFRRCGKANRKGGGVGLDWIGSLALGGRSEEAELYGGLSSIDSHLFINIAISNVVLNFESALWSILWPSD
jgi:hypothetical protein